MYQAYCVMHCARMQCVHRTLLAKRAQTPHLTINVVVSHTYSCEHTPRP